MRKKIFLIGAGQLGSRHLQALKAVKSPLEIFVIDANPECLKVARERYEAVAEGALEHKLHYVSVIPRLDTPVELLIVATNSDVRAKVVHEAVTNNDVRYAVLEKLLFQRAEEYDTIQALLAERSVKAWVNCSMRTMPFYQEMKNDFLGKTIGYQVTGSQYGLVTNAIHYIDHMSHLTGCNTFAVYTDLLDKTIIPSKRKGFLELNGTLRVVFSNGSQGTFTCYADGNAPVVVEIYDREARVISRESERLAWTSRQASEWRWEEIAARIPFQSEMTTCVAEEILSTGSCALVNFEESVQTHRMLLDALLVFINKESNRNLDYYPFT